MEESAAAPEINAEDPDAWQAVCRELLQRGRAHLEPQCVTARGIKPAPLLSSFDWKPVIQIEKLLKILKVTQQLYVILL